MVFCKQDSGYSFGRNVFIGLPTEQILPNSLNYKGNVHSFKNVLGICWEPDTVLRAGHPVPGLTKLT